MVDEVKGGVEEEVEEEKDEVVVVVEMDEDEVMPVVGHHHLEVLLLVAVIITTTLVAVILARVHHVTSMESESLVVQDVVEVEGSMTEEDVVVDEFHSVSEQVRGEGSQKFNRGGVH